MKTRALSISPSVTQQLCGDEIKATRRSVIEGFDCGVYIGPAKRAEVVWLGELRWRWLNIVWVFLL